MTDEPFLREPPGAFLRRQRKIAGLSQEEAADRSGLSVRTISDLERARTRSPYPRSVRLLVAALGLPETVSRALLAQYRAARDAGTDAGQSEIPCGMAASPGTSPEGEPKPATPIVPRQLPAAVAKFAGRGAELKVLDGVLERGLADAEAPGGTVVISAIGGTAGVGKTALAVHWAHQVAGKFPDGQLYVNLRGFDPSGAPVTPSAAIRGFLRALDVHPTRIPLDLDGQAALYRSLLTGRRMLIVLDNARDAAQVRPLLPGSAGSLVIVTSRSRLAGLAASDAAHLLGLDVLTEPEAAELLTARLGAGRIAAEPEAAHDVAALCARLPVALAIAAAIASAAPALPLSGLAAELADTQERLDMLDVGDTAGNIRAVFSCSYRQLGAGTARLFRLLGLHPGPDITAAAAASLAGIPLRQTRRELRALAHASLLGERVPGRYALHDLLRAYAAEQAATVDSRADRRAALGRMLDHYLHTASTAAMLLDPSRDPVDPGLPADGTAPEHPADYDEALVWFDAEHTLLLSAVRLAADAGFDTCARKLPSALVDFLYLRGHWHDMAATQQTAIAAAQRLGDRAGQALASRHLARSQALLGLRQEAQAQYSRALHLSQQLGDHLGEARCHYGLAWSCGHQSRYDTALAHGEQALAAFRAAGHRSGQATALNAIGWFHAHSGGYEQAIACCKQALGLCRELGDRHGEAATLDSLGYASHQLGRYPQAIDYYQQALRLFRELRDRYNHAATLINLGDTRQAAGNLAAAAEAWQQAVAILDGLHHPDADQVHARLQSLR